MKNRAFTLIELLVVIAIITLLIAILIPSLQGARSTTQALVCATNLRQISTGWTIYADQHNGAIVPGRMGKITGSDNTYWVGNGYQYRPRWYIQMGAAAGFFAYNEPSPDSADDNIKSVDNPLFTCPTRPEWTNNRNYTYGYNFQFLGNSRFFGDDEGNGFINFPVKIHHLSHLSSTVMAADTLGTSATYVENERQSYNVTGTDNELRQLANHGWSLDPPRLTPDSDYCDNKHRGEARSGPDRRHGGMTNFLFTDTHVERLAPQAVGYTVDDHDAYPLPGNPLNEEAHNRSFSGTGLDSDPPVVN